MRMKKFALAALACIFAASAAVAAPLDVFKGQKGEVDIAGGTAHIPVMQEAAKRIMTLNPDIRITVAGGGSGVGVKQVGEGLVEIGNTGPVRHRRRRGGRASVERGGRADLRAGRGHLRGQDH